MRIRKVATTDLTQLQEISRKTFTETYSSQNSEKNMSSYMKIAFSYERLQTELSSKNSEFYFAYFDNIIIGYLKVNFGKSQTELASENSLEIERIYVFERFQGKKVGHALCKKAIEVAKTKLVDFVWLGVWEKNVKAISFYEKCGFVKFDEHLFLLGDEVQMDIMMRLEIK